MTRQSINQLFVLASGVLICIGVNIVFFNNNNLPALNFNPQSSTATPEFKAISDIPERKQAFFEYLYPIVVLQNNQILEQRAELERLNAHFIESSLSDKEQDWILSLSSLYGLKEIDAVSNDLFPKLLNRVDYIPPDLALSQAAIESAWGTSRFATKANNYYGQWCYTKGCGLVPKQRSKHHNHEVKKFRSVDQAIYSYLNNLNSNSAYTKVRDIRKKMRNNNKKYSGHELATGLINYSEERAEYIHKVKSLIKYNGLESYIQPFN